MNKRKRLLILAACVLFLAAGVGVFFAETLWIPPSLQAEKIRSWDVFSGKHLQLSAGAQVYEVLSAEYVSHNDVDRYTVYRLKLKTSAGDTCTANLRYPGTPKQQYYGYPRLRNSMNFLVLANPENVSRGELYEAYLLFAVQEIDGEAFVYPLHYDSSVAPYSLLGERAAFTYKEESELYHPWYDADVLKLCPNREYPYKVRYADFMSNYTKILK